MGFNTNISRLEIITTGQQVRLDFAFKIFKEEDIKVYFTDANNVPDDTTDLLSLGVDYNVTINGDAGGYVTLLVPSAGQDFVTIYRCLDIDRDFEYQTNGDLLANTLNSDQDYQTYLIQDLRSNKDRYFKMPDSLQNVDNTLPTPRPLEYLRWNDNGTALENDTNIPPMLQMSEQFAKDSLKYAKESEGHATEAERSSVNSQSILNEFETLYLGAKATDPTIDNEGNALRKGASYYNTVLGEVKVWNGSGFVKVYSLNPVSVQYGVIRTTESQLLTDGQTDIVLQKVKYDRGRIEIFYNGKLLDNSASVLLNGVGVTLKTPAKAKDKVMIVGYVGDHANAVHIVDDLKTSDAHSALSANMGVKLEGEIVKLESEIVKLESEIVANGKIGSY